MSDTLAGLATRQATTVVTGAEVELGWSGGKFRAQWKDNTGATLYGAFKSIRNQSGSDVTIVVEPINGYTEANVKKTAILKLYAGETYGDMIFDYIVDSGSSLLDADILFYPMRVSDVESSYNP